MKEILAKGFPLRNLKIKDRKDWAIFWAFAVIIAYIAGGRFDRRIEVWLQGIHTPWLTDLNEPHNYGRTIVAVILLTVLAECVLFLCRKPIWTKAVALAAGLLLSLAIIGIYQVHCRLIVSVLWKEEPDNVSVVKDGVRMWDYEISGEEKARLLELCRSLEVIEDPKEQEACMAWYRAGDNFMGTDSIELYFPQRYGHSYMFHLRVKDGYVYLWLGYQGKEVTVTFYKDNGIVDWMKSERAVGQ